MKSATRIFFTTDIHGSTRCFRKFLNAGKFLQAQVLILGGDITGKSMVPIIRDSGSTFSAHVGNQMHRIHSGADLKVFQDWLENQGVYFFACERDKWQTISATVLGPERLFEELVVARMKQWVELADSRLPGQGLRVFVNAGNDDIFAIDAVLNESGSMICTEGKILEVDDDHTMISCGYANETPFYCPRDISELVLRQRIDEMAREVPDLRRCIFNLHCPPYGTALDQAVTVDDDLRPQASAIGVETGPVGSTAVLEAIREYQPLISLHGHIHESAGEVRIGKTLCVNPGSEYWTGTLKGYLISIRDGVIEQATHLPSG